MKRLSSGSKETLEPESASRKTPFSKRITSQRVALKYWITPPTVTAYYKE